MSYFEGISDTKAIQRLHKIINSAQEGCDECDKMKETAESILRKLIEIENDS